MRKLAVSRSEEHHCRLRQRSTTNSAFLSLYPYTFDIVNWMMFGCSTSTAIPAVLSLCLSAVLASGEPSSPEDCAGKGAFALTLLGRKQSDGQWNTTYDLKGSSCNASQNWRLVLYQNVTEVGKMQHVHLRGYFADNGNMTVTDASELIRFDKFRRGFPDFSGPWITNGGSSSTKFASLPMVSRFNWNAKLLPSFWGYGYTRRFENLEISDMNGNCSTLEECVHWMQEQQTAIFKRNQRDLYYHFYVAGDGRVYEGIGWEGNSDHHLRLMYVKAGSKPPTERQFFSMARLISEGYRIGKIKAEYVLSGKWLSETKKAMLELVKYVEGPYP